MPHPVRLSRRRFLDALSAAAAAPLLARCARVTTPPPPLGSGAQRLRTSVTRTPDGTITRLFTGRSAPDNVLVPDPTSAGEIALYDLFPNDRCPFAIDQARELGPGGYALETPDRTLMGILPVEGDEPWALNMIPCGVAADGVILDPSGPWYDGGPADPHNPFDRACSGWEYDPLFPSVGDLLGVPADVRGHVQPAPGGRPGSEGQFHYHGTPRVLVANLRAAQTAEERSRALVTGYSADGYWILDAIVPRAASRSGRRLHLVSGYVLREGPRARVPHTHPDFVPPDRHDGTIVQDWIFDPDRKRALVAAALRNTGEYEGLQAADVDAGLAEVVVLDALNGLRTRALALPSEVPEDSYAYAMTPDWPEIPRWLAYQPSPSFRTNLIPFSSPDGRGPPGRDQLYAACEADAGDVHVRAGRDPY